MTTWVEVMGETYVMNDGTMANVAPMMNWVICMEVRERFRAVGTLMEKADRV